MESMLNREWRGAIVSVATDSTGVGFLRRKTNPFMERKENHMIIARAAKGAALLLMIFGVVAFIGCQANAPGPAGPAGPKGATGDPGAAGGQGPQGAPGPAALQAKSGSQYALVFNATGDDGDEIGDLTSPNGGSLDLSDAFIGGVPPVTYEATGTTENDRIKVVVTEDGMATVTKKEGATTFIAVDFTTGFNFTVTATDANKITAQTTVTVTANRKPRRQVQNFEVPSNGLPGPGTRTELAYVVGTQPKLGEGTSAKVAWNKFEARTRNSVNTGRGILVGPGNGFNHWVFADESRTDVEITITEVGAAGEADDEEYIMAEVTKSGELTVTGVKSTWDADASTPIHKPVPVEFTATDPGGLTETLTAYVWVDGAPVQDPDAPLQASYIVKKADGTNNVIGNLGGFFKDPEGATTVQLVNADVSSSNELVATAAITGTGTGTALAVTPVNPGNATITVYGSAASNTAGGNAAINASSTVAAAVDRNGDGTVDADDGDTEAANGVLPGAQFGVLTVNVQVIP